MRLSQTRCKGSNFSINTKPCTLFFQKNIRKVLVSALFMPLSACFGWFCWACEASHACVVERIEVAYMGNVGSHPTFSIHGLRLSSTTQNAVACSSIAPAGLLPVPMPRFDVSARRNPSSEQVLFVVHGRVQRCPWPCATLSTAACNVVHGRVQCTRRLSVTGACMAR